MSIAIGRLEVYHWEQVSQIYLEGILTRMATFQTAVPSWEAFDASHVQSCRLIAYDTLNPENVLGFAVLTPVSSRCVYCGVAEVSVYVAENARGKGIGKKLLSALVKDSEKQGFWTLQSSIISKNIPSIEMHSGCGFRIVGYRDRIAKMEGGTYMDTVLMEKRSTTIGLDQ